VSAAPVCLAVDVGTSGVRAALVSLDGEVVRTTRRPRGDVGGRSFDAAALWNVVSACLRDVCSEGPEPAAIGVAAHVGAVLADAAFEPVGPGAGWADTTGIELSADLDLYRAGRPAAGGGLGPFAAAHERTRAADARPIAHALSPTGYLVARLTEEATADRTNAAYSFLLDVRTGGWQTDRIASLGLAPSMFPRLAAGTEVVGTVTARATRETGLRRGTPVVAGGPDGSVGAAAIIGGHPRIADISGTTDVLVKLVDRPPDGGPLVVNPFLDGRRWTVGGSTGLTGGALEHWARLLGFDDAAGAVSALGDAVGRTGRPPLIAGPELTGARFPRWDASARGILTGLSTEHDATDIVHAVAEGGAFVVREGLEILGTEGFDVVVAGGATRSRTLVRIRAAALGREMLVPERADSTLLGAAMLAAVGAGAIGSLDDAQARMGPAMTRVDPRPESVAGYEERYRTWLEAVRGD